MSARDAVLVHRRPRVTLRWSADEERWNWKLHRAVAPQGAHVTGGGHWSLLEALADAGRAVKGDEFAAAAQEQADGT